MSQDKFQVFVSSTFDDLRDERQACVAGILSAGHIPAGMELFAADDRAQLDTIRQWIDESDVFMLLLGSRYGSIETETKLSYTQLEYEYAVSINKPLFAVVLSERWIEEKVKVAGTKIIEKHNSEKLNAFRDTVLSRMVKIVSSEAEIKLAIFESIGALARRHSISGWKRSSSSPAALGEELARLSKENERLRQELASTRKQPDTRAPTVRLIEGRTVREWATILHQSKYLNHDGKEETVLESLLMHGHVLAAGVDNSFNASAFGKRLFQGPASHLLSLGLAEHGRTPAKVFWSKIQLSKLGKELLVELQAMLAKESKGQTVGAEPAADAGGHSNEMSAFGVGGSVGESPSDATAAVADSSGLGQTRKAGSPKAGSKARRRSPGKKLGPS